MRAWSITARSATRGSEQTATSRSSRWCWTSLGRRCVCLSGLAPRWGAWRVVPGIDVLTVDRLEGEVEPAVRARQRFGQCVARIEPDRARLQRMNLQLTAEHAAVEHQRIHREHRETESQPVEHRDE